MNYCMRFCLILVVGLIAFSPVNGFDKAQLSGEHPGWIEASVFGVAVQNGGSCSSQRSACRSSVQW